MEMSWAQTPPQAHLTITLEIHFQQLFFKVKSHVMCVYAFFLYSHL